VSSSWSFVAQIHVSLPFLIMASMTIRISYGQGKLEGDHRSLQGSLQGTIPISRHSEVAETAQVALEGWDPGARTEFGSVGGEQPTSSTQSEIWPDFWSNCLANRSEKPTGRSAAKQSALALVLGSSVTRGFGC
jgi:hypothetical protein